MSDPKPGILRNLRVKRVSLVDAGANFDVSTQDGAHIMLFKRAPVSKDGPSLGSVHVDSPSHDDEDADEYEKADLTGPGRRSLPDSAFAAVWTDAQGKKHRKLPIHDSGHLAAARGRIAQAQIPADVKAAAQRKIDAKSGKSDTKKENDVKKSIVSKILGLFNEKDETARVAKAAEIEAEMATLEKAAHDADDAMCKCDDCMAKKAPPFGADVAKAISEVEKRHQTELAKVAKENSDLRADIAIEKAARLDGEMRIVLKSFKATSFDLDKDVAKFRKMKDSDPEMFARTMEILKASDAMLAESALFKNFGSGAGGGGKDSAYAELEAKAAAMVEKSTGGLTKEAAFEKACLDNPKLVARYRQEQQ